MKVAVLADEEVSAGFMLAGVKEVYKAPEDVEKLLQRADIAVVFFQEDLLKELDRKTLRRMEMSTQPVFVPIGGEDEDLKELMKQALGVEVI